MIRRNFKSVVFFYFQIITVWILAWLMFYFFRQYGIDEFLYVEFIERPRRHIQIGVHIGVGVFMGVLYASFELLFEKPFFQKRPFGYLILIKILTYLVTGAMIMVLAVMTYQILQEGKIIWSRVGKWLTSITFLAGLLHLFFISTLISFIRQLNYKCGPGVLWDMFWGKYHHPREEERIFMFLDLKSSTTIAEKLGHIRFSRLIQDCFFDLTDILLLHDTDIYQYVGDEVILTWKVNKGINENHCVACYFDYQKLLDSKKEYYTENYGVQPFFKAGIHFGKVTVAEVGVLKKEISYHGDVLNTAARIQGRCNDFKEGLLISQELKNALNLRNEFLAKEMGVERLRGKEKEVVIFGIEEL